MGNMSYCRFENTLEDLRDCFANLDDDLSKKKDEARARIALVKVCQRIVDNADLNEFQTEYEEAKKEVSNG